MNDNIKRDYEDDLMSDLQEFEIKKMLEEANKVVLTFVAVTGATAIIPIPFADAPMLIGEQMAMMALINGVFKMDVGKGDLKLLANIGTNRAAVLGRTIAANLFKLIPGVGSVVGGTISAGTAGIITLALGNAYIQVCKAIKMGKLSQDSLTNIEGIDAFKAAFKEQIKKNKNEQPRK